MVEAAAGTRFLSLIRKKHDRNTDAVNVTSFYRSLTQTALSLLWFLSVPVHRVKA